VHRTNRHRPALSTGAGFLVANHQYLNAGVLFRIAKTAYERTKAAPADLAGDQNDALVAILFAAATLEAFVMELATIAQADGTIFGNARMQALSTVLEEAEASRGSARLKYLLTKTMLTGASYNRGARPYQDFETLFTLRDAIVHLKPENARDRERLLARLSRLGVLEELPPNQISSWVSQVATRAATRWAYNVVSDMVASIAADVGDAEGDAHLTTAIVTNRFERVD
jgi:hypothetical protein